MGHRKIELEGVDRIHLAKIKDQWQAFIIMDEPLGCINDGSFLD